MLGLSVAPQVVDGGGFQQRLWCYYQQETSFQDWLTLCDITTGNLKIVGGFLLGRIWQL